METIIRIWYNFAAYFKKNHFVNYETNEWKKNSQRSNFLFFMDVLFCLKKFETCPKNFVLDGADFQKFCRSFFEVIRIDFPSSPNARKRPCFGSLSMIFLS